MAIVYDSTLSMLEDFPKAPNGDYQMVHDGTSRFCWAVLKPAPCVSWKHDLKQWTDDNIGSLFIGNVHPASGEGNKNANITSLNKFLKVTEESPARHHFLCGDFNTLASEMNIVNEKGYVLLHTIDYFDADKRWRVLDNCLMKVDSAVFDVPPPVTDLSFTVGPSVIRLPESDHEPIDLSLSLSSALVCRSPACRHHLCEKCPGSSDVDPHLCCGDENCMSHCACGSELRCYDCVQRLLKSRNWKQCQGDHVGKKVYTCGNGEQGNHWTACCWLKESYCLECFDSCDWKDYY